MQKKFFYSIFLFISVFYGSLSSAFMPGSEELFKVYLTRTQMPFGNPPTDIETYIFTNWESPDTQNLYAFIKENYPKILEQSKLYFIDQINEKTDNLNWIRHSYLLTKNKNIEDYFKIIDILSQHIATPTNSNKEQINETLASKGFKIQLIDPSQEKSAAAMTKMLFDNLKIKKIPSIVIYNLSNQKSVTVEGIEKIKKMSFKEAFQSIKTVEKQES